MENAQMFIGMDIAMPHAHSSSHREARQILL